METLFSFSPSNNAFYDNDLHEAYVSSGNWPEDCYEVSEDMFNEFAKQSPPQGKVRGVNSKGKPVWKDIPPLTQEQIETITKNDIASLTMYANEKMQPLKYAQDLGDISEEEQQSLLSWKKYVLDLYRLKDSPEWPSVISWPEMPQ